MSLTSTERNLLLSLCYPAVCAAEGSGEEPEWPDQLPADALPLADLMWEAERYSARWKMVAGELRSRLLSVLEGSQGVHDGEWAYRPTRKHRRFATDPVKLLLWLGSDAGEVVNLEGADPVRIGALRAVARRRVADLPEAEGRAMVQALEDTLFWTEWGEVTLDRVRLDDRRCPKFVREAPVGVPIGRGEG